MDVPKQPFKKTTTNKNMIYFKYNQSAIEMNPEGAYFMPNDMQYAQKMLNDGVWSSEVNTINKIRDIFDGTTKSFVDIGANVGTYTMVLAPVFKMTYAFEPCVETYNLLCANMALHNLSSKTKCYNLPLGSDTTSEVTFVKIDTLGGNNYCYAEEDKFASMYESWKEYSYCEETKMDCATLDSFKLENVGLMKIDVEGFEYEVLKGAKNTLIYNEPDVIIESWSVMDIDNNTLQSQKTTLRENIFRFMEDIGYVFNTEIEKDLFYFSKKKIIL